MHGKILGLTFSLSAAVVLLASLSSWEGKPENVPLADIQKAVNKSLLILQKSGYLFINRNPGKCASCHHNTLTAIAVDMANQKGLPTIDSFTAHRRLAMLKNIDSVGNPNLLNNFLPANFIYPYMLIGLQADHYPPSLATDISVDYIMSQAKPNGSFLAESGRTPMEGGDIHMTAVCIRAIQAYASPAKGRRVGELVDRARVWIENAHPEEEQELVFQLLGMHWCGSSLDAQQKVAEKLLSMQNPDGGWSQLPRLSSDAYGTGQTLYALAESGQVKPQQEPYQKGISWLLKNQDETGAWIVATRSYPIQPFFNSDFPPYNEDQFISAAGSGWSVLALLEALPDKRP